MYSFLCCVFVCIPVQLKKGGVFMDELFKGLIEQSFPVVISVYLLVRLEAKLDTLEKTINALNIQIQKIC